MPPTSTKRTIHADSMLMQDVLQGSGLPVADGDGRVALFANPFNGYAIEALIVGPDGKLLHGYRTAAGWATSPIAASVQSPASRVVAVTAPDGKVWAFFTATAFTTPLELTAARAWQPREGLELSPKHSLRVSYLAGVPAQRPVVYGADSQGQMFWYAWTVDGESRSFKDNPWAASTGSLKRGVRDVLPVPSASTDVHHSVEAIMFVAPDPAGRVVQATLQGTANLLLFSQAHDTSLSGVTLVDGLAGKGMFVGIADERLRVYSTLPGATYVDLLVKSTVETPCAQAALANDSYGLAHVYLLGKDRSLSVLHQTGWAIENGMELPIATWAHAQLKDSAARKIVALPLESEVKRFSVLAHPDHTALMIQRTDDAWELMTQDRASGVWTREAIQLAAGAAQAPVSVKAYRTQLTLLDANGSPVAGEVLQVTADELVQVSFGDRRALIGPGLVQDVVTDVRGRASVVVPASGLSAPVLSVTANGVNNGRVVRPDAKIHAYLGGTGTLPTRPALTGAVLKDASVRGKPLVPSWGGVAPDDVVKSMRDVYGAVSAPPGAAGGGFVLQTLDDSQPAFRAIATVEEHAALLAAHATHPAYAGALEDAAGFLGDLWEGVRRVGAVMEKAAITVFDGAVTLVVKLGDVLVSLGTFVLKTLRNAADVVMAMFTTLKAKVDDAVEWLASLFDFAHTWNTALAFEDGFGKLVTTMTAALAQLDAPKICQVIDGAEADVLKKIADFKLAQKGRSMQDFVPPQTAPATTAAAGATPLPGRADLDGALGNWFVDRVSAFSITAGDLPGAKDLTAKWLALVTSLGSAGDGFVAALQASWAKLALAEPRDLARVAVDQLSDLFSAVVSAVFGFAKLAVTGGFALIEAGLAGLLGVLQAPLDAKPLVALVNWIARQANPAAVDAETVSLGRFGCLMMAFPVTLGWKLACGAASQPFPHGKFEATLAATAAAPNLWGLIAGLLQLLYAPFDMVNDTLPATTDASVELMWALGALIIEGGILMCTFPNANGTPFEFASDPTLIARIARNSHFGCYAALFTLDGVSLAAGTALAPFKSVKKLVRQRDQIGKILSSAVGVSAFGFGIFESAVVGATPATWATNLFTPLSPGCQWLRLNGNTPSLEAKLIVNLFSDLVGGGFRLAGAAGM